MPVDGVTVVRAAPEAADQDYQVFIEDLVRDARFDEPVNTDLSPESVKLRAVLVQEKLGQQPLNVANSRPSVLRRLGDQD